MLFSSRWYSRNLKFSEPESPQDGADLRFLSGRPYTSLHCEVTTDTALKHRAVCLYQVIFDKTRRIRVESDTFARLPQLEMLPQTSLVAAARSWLLRRKPNCNWHRPWRLSEQARILSLGRSVGKRVWAASVWPGRRPSGPGRWVGGGVGERRGTIKRRLWVERLFVVVFRSPEIHWDKTQCAVQSPGGVRPAYCLKLIGWSLCSLCLGPSMLLDQPAPPSPATPFCRLDPLIIITGWTVVQALC